MAGRPRDQGHQLYSSAVGGERPVCSSSGVAAMRSLGSRSALALWVQI